MSEWKMYFKNQAAEMRPYVPGESLDDISVQPDYEPKKGDMIARAPNDHEDMWLISEEFFNQNYVPSTT